MFNFKSLFPSLSFIISLCLLGCGEGDSNSTETNHNQLSNPRIELKINSKHDWLYEGEIISLQAILFTNDGDSQDITDSVKWNIFPQSNLSVEKNGYFLAKQYGRVIVKAKAPTGFGLLESAPVELNVIRFPQPCDISNDIVCLPVITLNYSGKDTTFTASPSLDLVQTLGFKQSLSFSKMTYFYTKKDKSQGVCNEYPVFSVNNPDDNISQYSNFCSFLNELNFFGINAWRITDISDIQYLYKELSSISSHKVPISMPYLSRDGNRYVSFNLATGIKSDLPDGKNASYISCVY
ncbi:hypothetical protein ACPFUK_003045 [Vibrio cholerae]|uniref:hypothetical protein n=1 Tax=Vibrio cholerae TaxID=666 RepID=UPI0011D77D38|nr:hypothetical protein [Vibrio cholerae]TXX84631.1 hypothetical protein FXE94_07175 [Vibrio cholerae]GHY54089.1 Bacterial Ig-like domain-containing protein [Vibrio cholerae]GIA62333.1 Bacterial Ig-like domain-containing protein [Vibrio cholerae]